MKGRDSAIKVLSILSKIPISEYNNRPTQRISMSFNYTNSIQLSNDGILPVSLIYDLIDTVENIFISEENIIRVEAPVVIIGDIHGQFGDLIFLMRENNFDPLLLLKKSQKDNFNFSKKFLFLGDYVDRGPRSIETICYLFAAKILFPDNILLLRGNHECWYVNKAYGFYDEVRIRYSQKLWRRFTKVFEFLPFSSIIDEKIFCCHGGISPELLYKNSSLRNIDKITRPTEVPTSGLLCDLLWSDPCKNTEEFGPNTRGTSFTFGKKALDNFLENYDLDLVCRAHQVVQDGHEFFHDKKLVTIFSAPNYCNFNNKAAYMCVDENLVCSFTILGGDKNCKDKNN